MCGLKSWTFQHEGCGEQGEVKETEAERGHSYEKEIQESQQASGSKRRHCTMPANVAAWPSMVRAKM